MAQFCLTKQAVNAFKKGIKDGEIDPLKLSLMESSLRNEFLSKFVGKENAVQVNALFESKLLLKNQKAGYISWAKKVSGITPQIRRDLVSRIEKLETVLNPKEEEKFLKDLASTRLNIDVTQEEAKTISELSQKSAELKNKANKDGIFPNETQRLEYGASKVALEKYINEVKLDSKKISFLEHPGKKILNSLSQVPGVLKSAVASLDNSFWGRQGIKTILDVRTSQIWAKNFLKSFGDIGKELVGFDAIDAIKADIYSRPNALNGKYDAGKYGLSVLSEEAYPSSLPERIPLLGRVFKASEAAYNGGALRLRADLADRLIKTAERQGVNTLDPKEALGMGRLVSSLTGRGNLGKAETLSQEINTLFFSIKFLKSNFDTLTAHRGILGIGADQKVMGSSFARKESAKSLLSIIGTLASVLTLVKLLDPKSVEEDPRGTNFGRVKIFGHWTDITGGMASLVTLAARLTPTYHGGVLGFWTKNSAGNYTNLSDAKYGGQTALDVFDSFWQGKLSPLAGIFRDIWKGKDFSGQPITLPTELFNVTIPLSIQTLQQFLNDPSSTNVLGSMIFDSLGFGTSTTPQTNIKLGLIPEGAVLKNDNFIDAVKVYAKAMQTDPETAFNRIFSGQKIVRVTNGTVMVQRMTLGDSTTVKKKSNANNPTMKLDHTVPLELGGSNDTANLKIVTTSEWSSYTKVENVLGKALKSGKISKKEAQAVIQKFKAIQNTERRKSFGDTIITKYK